MFKSQITQIEFQLSHSAKNKVTAESFMNLKQGVTPFLFHSSDFSMIRLTDFYFYLTGMMLQKLLD